MGTVEVFTSMFMYNEAGAFREDTASGGDIYAADGVTLKVQSSNFFYSVSKFGGASIECCGASITDSTFVGGKAGTESSVSTVLFFSSVARSYRLLLKMGVRAKYLCYLSPVSSHKPQAKSGGGSSYEVNSYRNIEEKYHWKSAAPSYPARYPRPGALWRGFARWSPTLWRMPSRTVSG